MTKYLTPGRVYPDDEVAVEDGDDAEASSGAEHDDAESSSEALHAVSDDEDAGPTKTAVSDANVHPDASTATTATSTPGITNPVDSAAPSSAAGHDGDAA